MPRHKKWIFGGLQEQSTRAVQVLINIITLHKRYDIYNNKYFSIKDFIFTTTHFYVTFTVQYL